MKVKRRLWTWVAALLAVFTLVVGGVTPAYAAAGDTPPHTKTLTDNQDGTYTLSLDVVGEAEKKPNPVNVIVILDRSGSMANPNNTNQRMNAAKNAVNNLADALFAYNTASEPNTVQMALITFSNVAESAQAPTNSATTFKAAVNRATPDGGTNWEAALQAANNVSFGDNDQTFVIFVSDGNPTFRFTEGNYPNHINDYNQTYYRDYGVWGSGNDTGTSAATTIARCYEHAVDDAKTLATKVTPTNFFTIGAFGNVNRMESLTNDAGSNASTNYYSAQDTAALNQAIADILAKIEMMGIGNASIEDGTTNQVTTTSGAIAELLEVDTSSFKYYKGGSSWAEAPAAEFKDGAVEWDLSGEGVLETGVRYTVTFDCYPSQYTYDTIAKLKNGDLTYSELDPEVQKYIVDNGNGTYSLRTNTNATLSWDDTRDEAGQQTDEYKNPDPVRTDSSQLTVNKEWVGASPDVDSLPITVMMDEGTASEAVFHTATLSAANSWSTSSYISVGIIKNGQALPGAEGHDFSFAELDDTQYRWELDAPTVRPMLIDGGGENHEITMLIKVDADHPAPSGAQTYTINGSTYYVDSAATGLTATNYRRSNLNLTKVVTGEDAPGDATFPFTLTVNNSKAPSTAPADDPEHNSDYYVWFSIYDTKAGATVTDATISGATGPNADGYYYAPSGSAISVQMKDSWNLRFTNLPSGTTYTFVEGTLADGFAFKSSELTQGNDSTFSGAQTTTGTIEDTQTSYYVTYTNDYQLTDLEITKAWDDAKNQDGKRLTADELKAKLTLSPAVDGKEPTIVDNGDDTYTITYTGLPRFNNGQEVEYTVAEASLEETGYTTTGSPAKDHGTITNTHTPEVTQLTIIKEWDDSDDIGKIRPASINVQLTADGTASGDPVALNADNKWTYTWENLPKYKDGKAIVYSADETAVPAGYDRSASRVVDNDGVVTVTVTNTYNPTPVSVDPPVQKVITGNDDLYNKGDFTFTIEATSPTDAPMPENTKITNSADYEFEGKTGFYEFGEITFTKPGTYTYKVTESGSVDGVTNDPDAETGKTLTFTVTDDGTGKLVVDPTTDQVQLSFTNVYNADGEASIVVSKEITGAAWPAGKTLTLTIAGTDNAPMPETTTATLNAAGSVTFGPITYGLADAGKTYEYTITEDSFGAGWSGDPASVKATVAVTDNGDGTLKTEVTYSPEDATFTNTYKAEGKATIEIEKAVEGTTWPEGKKITMTLAGTDSAPMPAAGGETVELTEAGKKAFGTIAYTEADAGKTYTYTISEDGFGTGWTGSGDVTATVVVTDNGNGTLSTEVTYSPESDTITNTYVAEGTAVLQATKAVEGAAWPEGKKITFTLAGEGGTLPETKTVELTEAGTASFGAITYDESDAGQTYTYTITEDGFGTGWTGAPESITATVKVTDNGDGTLKTEVTYDPANKTFTNTYKATGTAVLEATKAIEGAAWPEGKTITFTLAGEGGTLPETKTVTLTEPGKATFGAIAYTEADAGKTYTYTISEDGFGTGWTGAPESITATVKVTDNGDGTLKTEVTYSPEDATFTNTYEASGTAVLEATKAIEGAAWPEGKTITFTLAGEGGTLPETKTVTLTEAGTATFDAIAYDESDAGKTYTYTISEDGFGTGWTGSGDITATVVVTDNGDGTLSTEVTYSPESDTITNTYKAEGEVELQAGKKLEAAEGLNAPDVTGKYTLTLEGQDGAPMPEAATDGKVEIKNADGKGTMASFGTIAFDEADAGKTYTYKVTETGTVAGVENGTAEYTVKVKVNDNGDGTLEAEVIEGNANTLFTNTYKVAPTTASFPVEKVMSVPEGLKGPEAWSYDIAVAANDGAPVAETMTGKVDQDTTSVTFGPFSYAAPGTYTYTVSETGTVDGVTNDAEAAGKTVTVTVVDNGDGTLTATVDSTADAPLTFTNTYGVKEAKLSVPAKKTLVIPAGMLGPVDASWTFEMAPVSDGAPMPETTSYTVAPDETVNFGEISYTKPGDYQYKVTESGEVAGVKNDQNAYTVNVSVVDNGDGTLTATANYDAESPVVFTNEYNATPTSASFEAKKDLKGTPLSAGAFEFELKDADGNVVQTMSNDDEGNVTFEAIEYKKPGTYTYTITEINGGKGGYTYSENVMNVIVTVEDNREGALVATVAYTGETVFNNTYEADGDVDLSVKKELKGRTLEEGQFTFELVDENGKVLQTKTNNASGAVQFDTISYDQTIFDEKKATDEATTEEKPAEGEGTEEGLTGAAVEDEAVAEPETTTDEVAAEEAVAENVVTDEAVAEEATEVEAAPAEAAPAEADAAEAEDDGFSVSDIAGFISRNVFAPKIAWAEEAVELEAAEAGRSKTFTYTIREVNDGKAGYTYDDHEVTVTVTVTDDDEGNLTAVPVYNGSTTFINTYTAEGATGEGAIAGTKTVTGTDLRDGQFSFQLKDADGNVVEEVKNAADGSFAFSPLSYVKNAEKDETGTHEYTIVEVNDGQTGYTYDSHVCDVTVTVTDNGDGTLDCAVVLSDGEAASFTNPYKPLATVIPLTATKELTGRTLKAGEFTFELSDADGKVIATATNAADGSINFGDVMFTEPGEYTFTAKELKGNDSTITYDESVKTFTVEVLDENGQLVAAVTNPGEQVFKNKYTEPPAKKRKKVLPQTSDDSMPTSVVIATGIAGASLVAAGLSLRLRKDED